MSGVTVTPYRYRSERRSDLLRLMRQVWGAYMSEEEWEWWFARNPAGPAIISLAELDGQLVGAAAMTWFEMWAHGGLVRVPVPGHVATHPEHRGRGIFSALELENERRATAEGSVFAVTFPNDASRAVFVGRLGWRQLRQPRVWVRPFPFGRAPDRVDRLVRFAEAETRAGRAEASIARTARYLNWRFVDTPRRYDLLGTESGHLVLGGTCVRGVRLPFVADLAGPPGPAKQLLRAALHLASGAAPLLALEPAREHLGTFLSLGFVPSPRRILFLGKALTGTAAVLPERWRFTMGDLDFL